MYSFMVIAISADQEPSWKILVSALLAIYTMVHFFFAHSGKPFPTFLTCTTAKSQKWSKWLRTSSRDAQPGCSATSTSTRAMCLSGEQTTSPLDRRSLECAFG
jgi:hypothetical protein